MSHPTVATLKSQAARLVAYLGDKHRFRLKESSSLEALAIMHKAENWNTLQAMAKAQNSAGPHKRPSAQISQTLAWTAAGDAAFSVDTQDWYRHSLALASSPVVREKWLTQHFCDALFSGCAGVFINALGCAPANVREELVHRNCLLDMQLENGLRLNLLKGMSDAFSAWLLVTVDSADVDKFSTKADIALAVQVLTAVFVELRAQSRHPTLQQAARVCSSPEQLAAITAKGALVLPNEEVFPVGGKLARKLIALADERWCARLLSDDDDAPGLASLLRNGACLALDGLAGPALYVVFVAIQSIVNDRWELPWEQRTSGLVFGVGDASTAPTEPLLSLLQRARPACVALLLTAESKVAVQEEKGDQVLANIRNVVHLDGLSDEALRRVLASSGPVLQQHGLTIIRHT